MGFSPLATGARCCQHLSPLFSILSHDRHTSATTLLWDILGYTLLSRIPFSTGHAVFVDRSLHTPLWKQVHAVLADEIEQGKYPPGYRLPAESRLSDRFSVNRHTVRRALKALQEQGLIRTEQGLGSVVQNPTLEYSVSERTRFSENMRSNKASARSVYLHGDLIRADDRLARNLQLPRLAEVIHIEMLGVADGKKLYVSSGFFPFEPMRGLLDAFRASGSLTQAFAACGVQDYFRKSSRITARQAETADADLLELPRKHPLLVVEYVNVDEKGRPIEYGLTRFAADQIEIVIDGTSPEAP